MGQLIRSTMVDVPQNEAFALMADTAQFEKWLYGYAGMDEGPSRLADGVSFRWRMKMYGLTMKPRSTIVAFDEPDSYEEEMRFPGLMRGTLTMTTSQQKRRTQIKWVLDYRIIGGPLGVALDWAFAHRLMTRFVERSLAKAKEVLETPKQAPSGTNIYRRQTAVR